MVILIFIFCKYLVFWFLLRSSMSFLTLRFSCDGGGEIVFYNWKLKSQNHRIPGWKEPQASSGLKFLAEALKDLKYIIFSLSLRGKKNPKIFLLLKQDLQYYQGLLFYLWAKITLSEMAQLPEVLKIPVMPLPDSQQSHVCYFTKKKKKNRKGKIMCLAEIKRRNVPGWKASKAFP